MDSTSDDPHDAAEKQFEFSPLSRAPFGVPSRALELGQAFAATKASRLCMPVTTVPALRIGLPQVGAAVSAMKAIQQRTPGLHSLLQKASEVFLACDKTFSPLREPWRPVMERIGSIGKILEKYPDKMREGLVVMSRSGWYLDLQMGISKPSHFKQAVDEGREVDAEASMVEHFEARTAGIRAELVQTYPHRREILDAAFDAHLSGQYLVSIPVLLAQVDGICFDVANAHFFMSKERQKVVAHAAQLAGSEIARACLAPLESEMTIALSEKARPPGFTGLNRHMVLHGESVDYGTQENGLRAISLLNYISQSLQREFSEPGNGSCPETSRYQSTLKT